MAAARLLEVEILAKRDNCKVTNVLSGFKTKASLINLNLGVDESSHLLELGESYKEIVSALRREGVKVSAVKRQKILALSTSCDSCRLLAKLNAVILSARSQGKDFVLYRLLSEKAALKKILLQFEREGVECRVVEETPYVTLSGLTPRQSEIVLFALVNGYFDVRRRVSLTSIANHFSIRPATADLIMRRALRKIVDAQLLKKI